MPSTVDLIRKIASRQAFESLTSHPPRTPEEAIVELKLASVSDAEIFKTACALGGTPMEILERYERLGGPFEKVGFGTPMFAGAQMAGSPAVQGAARPTGVKVPQVGMGAAIPKPTAQPQMQPPVQAQGQGSTPMTTTTTTKQVVTPAAPAAPDGQAQSSQG